MRKPLTNLPHFPLRDSETNPRQPGPVPSTRFLSPFGR